MKCPQCGTEFEEAIEQCFTCGWDFAENPADFKPRTSKLAIFSLVLGILCLFTLYLPLLAAVIVGVVALHKIRKSRGKLTGKRLAMAGILVPLLSLPILLSIGYIIWSKDAGPAPNEFTEADLVQVRPENRASWDVLLRFCDNRHGSDKISAIGLGREDKKLLWELNDKILTEMDLSEEIFERISGNRAHILRLREKTKSAREIIHELSDYDEIADLATYSIEPYPEFCMNLVDLNKIACLYVLSTMQGNNQEALNEFFEMNRICRRYSVSARGLVPKLGCYSSMMQSLETANLLVNYSNFSDTDLKMVADHFQLLSEQHVSLKNPIIFEYLFLKGAGIEISHQFNYKDPAYKFNSTLRYQYSYCRNLVLRDEGKQHATVCDLSVWPWESPNWPPLHLYGNAAREDLYMYSLYYTYNPIGCLLLGLGDPDIFSGRRFQQKMSVLIKDDLFQWVLARRMGQEGSLKARAYSDEYTVDIEKGLVFSVGPDGEAYTEDDIKLRINPEVLGLSGQ